MQLTVLYSGDTAHLPRAGATEVRQDFREALRGLSVHCEEEGKTMFHVYLLNRLFYFKSRLLIRRRVNSCTRPSAKSSLPTTGRTPRSGSMPLACPAVPPAAPARTPADSHSPTQGTACPGRTEQHFVLAAWAKDVAGDVQNAGRSGFRGSEEWLPPGPGQAPAPAERGLPLRPGHRACHAQPSPPPRHGPVAGRRPVGTGRGQGVGRCRETSLGGSRLPPLPRAGRAPAFLPP